MPKKGAGKLKSQIKNRNKKKRKIQKQHEKQQQVKETQDLALRELSHVKQREEIELISDIYELQWLLKPNQAQAASTATPSLSPSERSQFSNIFDMTVLARPGDLGSNHCSITLRVRFVLVLVLVLYL